MTSESTQGNLDGMAVHPENDISPKTSQKQYHVEDRDWIQQLMGFKAHQDNNLDNFLHPSEPGDDGDFGQSGLNSLQQDRPSPPAVSYPGGFVGQDVDMLLFGPSLDEPFVGAQVLTNLQVPIATHATSSCGVHGNLYSPSSAFGGMTIDDGDDMGGQDTTLMLFEFSDESCFRNASLQQIRKGQENAGRDAYSSQSPNSRSRYEMEILMPVMLNSGESIPPVRISPCTREPSPCGTEYEVLKTVPTQTAPERPQPMANQWRKRHFSESAATEIQATENKTHDFLHDSATPENPTGNTYSQVCPLPSSRIIRRASSRLKKRPPISFADGKPRLQCLQCPDPRIYKEGQKYRLDELPVELLLEIFTYACSSLPVASQFICEHVRASSIGGQAEFGLPRRSTTNGILSGKEGQQMRAELQVDLGLVSPNSVPRITTTGQPNYTLGRRLRLLQARTICAIQRTCKLFNDILMSQSMVDNKLWRDATIACWGHLPKTLAEVQGWDKSSQTCWRNVFGVFMRSDNGLFRRKGNGGGAGGVEGFGGKTGFEGAILWNEEKALRHSNSSKEQWNMGHSAAHCRKGKGKHKAIEFEGMKLNPTFEEKRRKLVLVCTQPGPDTFTINALPGVDQGYQIGIFLGSGEHVFTRLDRYGNFGLQQVLPPGLRRSKKGYFPPDIFAVIGDRYQLVKVTMRKTPKPRQTKASVPHLSASGAHSSKSSGMEKSIRWNLRCVPEYVNDHRASVARCDSVGGFLVFNIFASRDGFIEGLDKPTEDPRVFCVLAIGYPGCNSTEKEERDLDNLGRQGRHECNNTIRQVGVKLSAKQRGKLPARDTPSPAHTIFRWQRTFIHPQADSFPVSQGLHYRICNLKLNKTHAAILIRWNVHSKVSYEEFVDREFHILDLHTGATIKVLRFPNFHWDFRHHDMTVEYNIMRHYKMKKMYNARHAGNRATRIHNDEFTLDDNGKLISGSHDYCIWVWDLNAEYSEEKQSQRVFNPIRNDAGLDDPFQVLDDFYWDGKNHDGHGESQWNTNNERAGWWVKTPNQVLCFWHNVATSKDGKWFAAVRAGRMFVWSLEDLTQVRGFTCAKGTYSASKSSAQNTTGDGAVPEYPELATVHRPASSSDPLVLEKRYLGQLLNPRFEKRLRNWFVWNKIIPEQGLWLMYDDGKVVYLNRDDILDACGLASEGKQWEFSRDDFGDLDEDDDEEDGGEGNAEDEATGSNEDEYAGEYMDQDLMSEMWPDDFAERQDFDWNSTCGDQDCALPDEGETEFEFSRSSLPRTMSGNFSMCDEESSVQGVSHWIGGLDATMSSNSEDTPHHGMQNPQPQHHQTQYLCPTTNKHGIRKRRRTSGSYTGSGVASNRSSFLIFDGPSSSTGNANGFGNGREEGNTGFGSIDLYANGVEGEGDDAFTDGGDVFVFENEKEEDAMTWEEMDPEGWLTRRKFEAMEGEEEAETEGGSHWHGGDN